MKGSTSTDTTRETQASIRRFFFQAEDGIRDTSVTGVQTCALPILYFINHPELIETWWGATVPQDLGATVEQPWPLAKALGLLVVLTLPRTALALSGFRSEERRVGKECGARGAG